VSTGVWRGRSIIVDRWGSGIFEDVIMAVMNNRSETRLILGVAFDIATAQLGIVSLEDMAFVKSMQSQEFGVRNISHCALRLD